jgi:hypothetical protein
MEPMVLLKLFVLSELIWIAALFLAMIITRVTFSIPRLLIIATVPTIAVLLPIGFILQMILGTVLMYTLIVKLTDAKLFPDAVLAVMVANVVYVLLGVWVMAQFA